MSLRLAGIALIVLFCSLSGLAFSRNCLRRVADLRWYFSALSMLKQKIRYTSLELPELLNEIAGRENYYTVSRPFSVQLLPSALSLDDQKLLEEFFFDAGMGDRQAEISRCEVFLKELEYRLNSIEGAAAEKARLIRSLGLLSGLAIGIMLL